MISHATFRHIRWLNTKVVECLFFLASLTTQMSNYSSLHMDRYALLTIMQDDDRYYHTCNI